MYFTFWILHVYVPPLLVKKKKRKKNQYACLCEHEYIFVWMHVYSQVMVIKVLVSHLLSVHCLDVKNVQF